MGPIVISSFPVLLQPVSQEFGWGRSMMSLGLTCTLAAATICSPLVGRLFDAYGSKRVLLPGLFVFGAAVASLCALNGSWTNLAVLFAILGAVSMFNTPVPYAKVLAGYFSRRRGLAMAIALGLGTGIGGALIPQITNALIGAVGWRGAYVGLGLLTAVISIPTIMALLVDPPVTGHDEPKADGLANGTTGVTTQSALATRAFWMLAIIVLLGNSVSGGVQAHLVAFLTDHGLTRETAMLALSACYISTTVGQAIGGAILDRVQTPKVAIPMFVILLLGITMIESAHQAAWILAGVALMGLGAGCEYVILPYFATRFFGLKSFSAIYGALFSAAWIAGGIGPLTMGWSFDTLGSYSAALMAFQCALVVAIVLVATLPRYRFTVG